jgi:transposase
MINDDRWVFVESLLPQRRPRTTTTRKTDPRAALAAVVYAVTTDTKWQDLPDVFGVAPSAAQRRFWTWTDADVWRRLAVAAIATPHARWARNDADAAIYRAGYRAHGFPAPEPDADLPDDEPAAELVDDGPAEYEPPRPRRYVQYSTDEYAVARDAMNRHDDSG